MASITGISRKLRQRQAITLMDGVRGAIEQWRSDLVPGLVSRHHKILGSQQHALSLTDVLTGRLDNQLSHAEASAALREAARSLASLTAPPTTWFVWENLSRAIGCFSASLEFTRGAFDVITERPIRSDAERARLFLAHIYEGDIDRAAHAWHTSSPTTETTAFWSDAGHLLWLLTESESGRADYTSHRGFAEDVAGRDVLVWGPAPVAETPTVSENGYVARVIAPGVTGFDSADSLGGRCDLAYASSRVTKALIAEGADSALDQFRWVSFRTDSWKPLDIPHGRTAHHHKLLLPSPWDKTNVIPLAVWDLLHVKDTSVTVGATTFFASAQAYTTQETRLKDESSGKTDERGSTGLRFERCLSLSHHNLSAHHQLMALLMKAGVVRFDQASGDVLRMSLDDYMGEIDALYGVEAV